MTDELRKAKASVERDRTGLENLLKTIVHLRPDIQYLSLDEITQESSSIMLHTDPRLEPFALNPQERREISARCSVRRPIESPAIRGRQLTAPIMVEGKVIQHVLHLISPEPLKQHITVTTDLRADLPPVNSVLLGIVVNLVANPIQAVPWRGNVSIRTDVDSGDSAPGTILSDLSQATEHVTCRLIIGDTGMEISPERLQRIFEPFFTTRYDLGEAGLGLSLCHRAVTDRGGRMTVGHTVRQ